MHTKNLVVGMVVILILLNMILIIFVPMQGYNIQDLKTPKDRIQTYKPDDFVYTHIDSPDIFKKYPQPMKFKSPPYVPPFTHFVILYRENHVFDDYLGDFKNYNSSADAEVMSPNHINDVPYLHKLAKKYALLDHYWTGVEPPSGPNHWYLFAADTKMISTQTGRYPQNGTIFDRYLYHHNNVTFLTVGDIYWFVKDGLTTYDSDRPVWLPKDRPGTNIPEELDYDNYTNYSENTPDRVIANDFINFIDTYGLPTFSYVELFNDHPGTYQNIPENDWETYRIVEHIMNNTEWNQSTVIIVTEDDTQNGDNGPDHVSNTYRVPMVVIANPKWIKTNYISHVAYNTTNVIALAERVVANVDPSILKSSPTDKTAFPMCHNDTLALTDPLEDLWRNGTHEIAVTASASTDHGFVPLAVNFTAQGSGGFPPYTYAWDFGDGTIANSANVTHTYTGGGTFTAKITVTDSNGNKAYQEIKIYVSGGNGTFNATFIANPNTGHVPLNVSFITEVNGGVQPYQYSWNFGDGKHNSVPYPSHKYKLPGNYLATLNVKDFSSNETNITKEIPVSPAAGPGETYVEAKASKQEGFAPLTIDFTGNIYYGTQPYSYNWDFGDGNSSTQQEPSHTFTVPGTYVVNFTAYDANGQYSYLITIKVKKAMYDVGVKSINSLVNNATYSKGLHHINATVANYGSTINVNTTLRIYNYSGSGVVFEDNMENGVNGWTHEMINATYDDWQLGTPSGSGAPAPHSGSNVWATNLDGNYHKGQNSVLVSPQIDLRYSSNAYLEFWHWYKFDYYYTNYYDGGVVEIENISDGKWVKITPDGGYPVTLLSSNLMGAVSAYGGDSNGWVKARFNLSAFCGNVVKIRFHFATEDTTSQYYADLGWYIDDVYVNTTSSRNLIYQSSKILRNMGGKKYVNWSYNFTPGRYLISVNANTPNDEVPENNYKNITIWVSSSTLPKINANSPTQVNVSQSITVNVTLYDVNSISNVTLYYSTGGTYIAVNMTLTGSGGDYYHYTATIPSQNKPCTVKYYVVATDSVGNINTSEARIVNVESTVPELNIWLVTALLSISVIATVVYKKRKRRGFN